MKSLMLIALILSTGAFAQEFKVSYDCAVKGLTASTSEGLRLGDPVKAILNSGIGTFSSKVSEINIAGLNLKGNVRYTKNGGAFPHAYELVANHRMLAILEVSNSGKNARVRSLSFSKRTGGYPVVANLTCVNF